MKMNKSLLLGMVFVLGCSAAPPAPTYDVLIRGGRVLDGTGTPWFKADVAILGEHIAAVGALEGASARRVIDAAGLYVAPGSSTPIPMPARDLRRPA